MKAIKPELKRLHSPDVFDLEEAVFAEGEPFCVLIQAIFAPEGEDGEESFDFVVCNAIWAGQKSRTGAFSGRHHIIVSEFSVGEITLFWKKVAMEATGSNWQEVAQKLGRYGKWEFEDYKDF